MKRKLQSLANRFGFHVSRIRDAPKHRPIDVLDLVVRDFLSQGNEMFFVQIGANDGERADPINRFVRQYHWPGLVVEPQPRAFARLRETYAEEPQLRFENCAISSTEGPVALYTVSDKVDFRWTGLARFSRGSLLDELAANGFSRDPSLIQSLTVPSHTLGELLGIHRIDRYDLLQIDAEGLDWEIIKMIDVRSPPSIIHFEHAHLSEKQSVECCEHLTTCGYELAIGKMDTIAYRRLGDTNI